MSRITDENVLRSSSDENRMMSTASQSLKKPVSDRRTTCEPADIMAMMNELEDDSVSEFIAVTSDRRITCDPSDVLAMMEDLDDEVDKSCSHQGNRRLTADPADMAAIMEGLEEDEREEKAQLRNDSVCSSRYGESPLGRGRESLDTVALVHSVGKMLSDLDAAERIEEEISALSRSIASVDEKSVSKKAATKRNIEGTRDQGNRRLTADPADMAAIMEGLEEDERDEKAQLRNDSVCSSRYGESPLGRGRESLDTVALVHSVGKMLSDLDDDEGNQGEMSALSGLCSSSGDRSSSKKAGNRRNSVCEVDLSMSLSCSTNSDSDQTMGTLDFIANIQSAIDAQEDGDDDTIMTSSSFGSMGGLLNMVTNAERQDKTAPVPSGKKAPLVAQSPRRSSRLSLSAGDVRQIPTDSMGPSPFVSTPSNRPSPSLKGLRSCLSSRTKAAQPLSAHSPTALARRNVVFGSPKVAEFNKTSPATNMTPMRKEVASRMFSMTLKEGDEDKADVDNSDEWDRLTNTSGGSPNQSEDEASPLPVPGSPAFNRRYYASDPDSPASIVAEYSSLRRSPRKKSSGAPSSRLSAVECDVSTTSQATGTVNLPSTLSELVETVECVQNKNKKKEKAVLTPREAELPTAMISSNVSCISGDDQTEELEVDLHSLIHSNRMDCPASDVDDSRDLDLDQSGSSVLMTGRDASHTSDSSVPSLGPLLGLHPLEGPGAYSVAPVSKVREGSSYSPIPAGDGLTGPLAPNAGSSFKQLDVSIASWEDNTSQISAAAANISVEGDTVELEVGLHDLMDIMGSPVPVGKKSKAKKAKKRKPLRTATPSLKFAAVEVSSPWVGDMSVISAVEDDHTERLEGNLGDLMSGVASPSQCDGRDSILWEQDENNCPGSREQRDADRSLNLSTASTRSVGSMELRQSMKDDDDVVTLQQGVRSSDIEYLNLVSGPAGETFSFADMSMLSTADRSMDTSTAHNRLSSVEGISMMRRLSALNAGARLNSLEQCGTPLAAKGSMSIGMKRHSLSVTRHMAQSSSKRARASVSGPCPLAPRSAFLSAIRPTILIENLRSTPLGIDNAEPASIIAAAELCDVRSSPPPCQASPSAPTSASGDLKLGPYSCSYSSPSSSAAQVEMLACSELDTSRAEASAEETKMQCSQGEGERSPPCIADAMAAFEGHAECSVLQAEADPVSVPIQDAAAAATAECARLEAERALERSAAEASEAALLLCKKRASANVSGRAQLKALQMQLRAAREQLDRSAEELRGLQSEVSLILESKKDFMVSLVEQREAADRDSTIQQEKDRAEAALAELQAAAEIQAAEKEYLAVKQGVGLLNRLTYCRVLSYQSTAIEIEAVLTSSLRVQVLFTLAVGKTSGVLSVDSTHVDLKYVDSSARTQDRETVLASAFFSDILCSEEVQGPLSEGFLSLVAHPADIPAAMQRISGFISAFRRCSTWLQCFSTRGWVWAMEGVNVAISAPTGHVLTVPLRVVVCGDVQCVRDGALRDCNGAVVFRAEMRSAIAAIQQRCPSPFGSFPSGQLTQAIEKFLARHQ